MKRGAGGSTVAGPIWNTFMRTALENAQVERFKKPDIEYPDKSILNGKLEEGTPIKIDKTSGLLATEFTPESQIEEKIFRTGHNILHYLIPEDPQGPTPSENDRDPFYPKWEQAVQRWMEENEWQADEGEIPTESDNVHRFEDKPSITINSPFEGETLSGDIVTFRVEANAPRGISRVEFYVDDVLVAQSRTSPYTGRYIPDPNLANGFHEMKAIAYDDIDNNESAQVNFNLLLNKTNISLDWKKPSQGNIFSEFDFPVQLEIGLPGSDYQKIEIFATPKENPSQYSLIRTITSISPTITTFWSNIPETGGEYELYTILWDQNNTPHRVSGVSVEIDVPEESI
jgi:hypothetical protein